MPFTIKNEKTCQMLRELARLTSESPSVAVRKSISERLERMRKKQGLAERILKIAAESAPLWKEPYKSMGIDELLYDEKGLPK